MSATRTVEARLAKAAAIAQSITDDESLVNSLIVELRENATCIDISNNDWLTTLPVTPGIYFFEIKFSEASDDLNALMRAFADNWIKWKSDGKAISPNLVSKRSIFVSEKFVVGDWLPLYIGKRTNLKSRISEHIIGPTNSQTSALRLRARANDLVSHSFRLSYLTLNLSKNEYKLMPYLEDALRSQLHPILGRQ